MFEAQSSGYQLYSRWRNAFLQNGDLKSALHADKEGALRWYRTCALSPKPGRSSQNLAEALCNTSPELFIAAVMTCNMAQTARVSSEHAACVLCGRQYGDSGRRQPGLGKAIALDIARGLAFLHARHVVHLDLKSPNGERCLYIAHCTLHFCCIPCMA